MRAWIPSLGLVGCSLVQPGLAEGEHAFRELVEASEGSLDGCPDAFLAALEAPITLERSGRRGVLGLLGEEVPVVFHDGEGLLGEPPGAFPEDFAAGFSTEGFDWWLGEVERARGVSVTVVGEDESCAVIAVYE